LNENEEQSTGKNGDGNVLVSRIRCFIDHVVWDRLGSSRTFSSGIEESGAVKDLIRNERLSTSGCPKLDFERFAVHMLSSL